MIQKKIFLFLIVTSIIYSCKKDEVITPDKPEIPCDTTFNENFSFDTIFPSHYFMAYPGSWWEYDDGAIDSCLNWVEATLYQVDKIENCVTIDIDKKIVPLMSAVDGGTIRYISSQSQIYPTQEYTTTISIQIITEVVGNECYYGSISYGEGEDWNEHRTTYKNIAHLDSIDINGIFFYDIICMEQDKYTYSPHNGYGPHYTINHYYAKEVGLIRRIQIFPYYTDTINLVNYHIEPY